VIEISIVPAFAATVLSSIFRDAELTANLRRIIAADHISNEWQAVGVWLRLFMRMLVVKTMTGHVFFVARRS